jgi:methyl-accepting chemotaxis protein
MAKYAPKLLKAGFLPKLLLVCFITVVMHDTFWVLWTIDKFRNEYREAAQTKTMEEVEIAYSVITRWHDFESAGSLSKSEAQASALAELAQLRYVSKDGDGYFWVTDSQPVLLADAGRPDLVSTNVGSMPDNKGNLFYRDVVDMAVSRGEGYYTSYWQDDSGNSNARLSYVKSFPTWGWVVGTETTLNSRPEYHLGWAVVGIGLVSIGASAVLLLWIVIRYTLERPLSSLVRTSEALSQGEIDQQISITSHDEIGTLAAAYAKAIDYLREMAAVATRVADGDLSVEVKPKSEGDILGNAHARLIMRQRDLIGKVKAAASNVAEASRQLSRASEQTAQAAQQISNTIQDVAKGASGQSSSLQQTAGSMGELTAAVDRIAKGVQEQAQSIERADGMVKEVSVAIAEVSASAQVGTKAWEVTAVSAAEGARKTHETVNGMGKIKEAMDLVSMRVADLGKRSDEIGKIVATIDDIAAQTNLLALNAAIEAARAGEQGRGFAVVADEVRKLAERSSVATKEIAVLVGGIQGTVHEAVNAMHRGSQEIEGGYQLATDAGASLDVILERSRVASKQVERISSTASQVTELSSQVVAAIEEISRVVEENAASTEQMTEDARSVSNAVGDSTSIAERNGAAAQEVSASVEEMSAQVEETLAAAHSLSDMSEEMERAVAVFKVN